MFWSQESAPTGLKTRVLRGLDGRPWTVLSIQGMAQHTHESIEKLQTGAVRKQVSLKTTKSCQRCRDVKKKCSRTKPKCELCEKAGEHCVYRAKGATTADLEARVAWLSSIINDNLPSDTLSVESLETGAGLDEVYGHRRDSDSDSLSNQRDLEVARDDGAVQSDCLVPILDQIDEQPISATHVSPGGSSSALENNAIPPEVTTASFMAEVVATPIQVTETTVPVLQVENDRSESNSAAWPGFLTSGRDYSRPQVVHTLPPDAACRRFVDAYFHQNHRIYPFIDRAIVLAVLNDFGKPSTSLSQAAHQKLYLIMAIGSATLHRAGQVSDEITARLTVSSEDILQN